MKPCLPGPAAPPAGKREKQIRRARIASACVPACQVRQGSRTAVDWIELPAAGTSTSGGGLVRGTRARCPRRAIARRRGRSSRSGRRRSPLPHCAGVGWGRRQRHQHQHPPSALFPPRRPVANYAHLPSVRPRTRRTPPACLYCRARTLPTRAGAGGPLLRPLCGALSALDSPRPAASSLSDTPSLQRRTSTTPPGRAAHSSRSSTAPLPYLRALSAAESALLITRPGKRDIFCSGPISGGREGEAAR